MIGWQMNNLYTNRFIVVILVRRRTSVQKMSQPVLKTQEVSTFNTLHDGSRNYTTSLCPTIRKDDTINTIVYKTFYNLNCINDESTWQISYFIKSYPETEVGLMDATRLS
jgi:hypothetical protein